MSAITVKELATELGQSVMAVSQQVSALCGAWGPLRVVAHAAGNLSTSSLHDAAADQIRSLYAQTPAGAA